MRLRQLRTTQSIVFVAPPEVHQSILDVCHKESTGSIDSSNVVTWLLDQTCRNLEEMEGLYFAQGVNFCRRMQAGVRYKDFLHDVGHRKAYLSVLQLPEQQTLEELYKPRVNGDNIDLSIDPMLMSLKGQLRSFMTKLNDRKQQSKAIQCAANHALEEVEQEREVAYEIEEERQVQRPPYFKPYKFTGLHRSIELFATSGSLEGAAGGYVKASAVLKMTQLGVKHEIDGVNLIPHLYLSAEFPRTVHLKPFVKLDNMMVRVVIYRISIIISSPS